MLIRKICIVGGGSSGWMAGLALLKNTENVEITLIESSKIGNVGVGEATIPFVATEFEDLLGLQEQDWMKECDAVYKSAIRFVNFKSNSPDDIIYHPFFSEDELNTPTNWWLNKSLKNNDSPYDYYRDIYFSTTLCELNRFGKAPLYPVETAHNLNADLFGKFCKKICTAKGLKHIDAIVTNVTQDDNGIKSVSLDNGDTIEADFFIDATGFKALLIEKTLGDKFISIEDKIINNKSLFARLDYKNKEVELVPYVNCTAKSSGWIWKVPLWSRTGNGYVYSDNFISDEEAEKEFIEHLGTDEVDVKMLKMRVGYQENPWTKNCLALPLAGGFVEPLESSGLMLTIATIKDFINIIKQNNNNISRLDSRLFNMNIVGAMTDVVDFIQAHYIFTDREDTAYWDYIKNELQPTDSLIDKLHILKTNWGDVYNSEVNKSNYGFPIKSWEVLLMGLKSDIITHKFRKIPQNRDDNRFFELFKARREEMKLEALNMTNLTEYLKKTIYAK